MASLYYKIFVLCIVTITTLISCNSNKGTDNKILGVWELRSTKYLYHTTWEIINYNQKTLWNIYTSDSIVYKCYITKNETTISAEINDRGYYQLKQLSPDSVLYTEGGDTYPLRFINDSTLILQQKGTLLKMHKLNNVSQSTIDKIIDLFEYTDIKIKTKNNTLIIYIIALIVVAVILIYLGGTLFINRLKTNRKLRELEQEYAKLSESEKSRHKDLEEEFFASEYYINLMKQLNNTIQLDNNTWQTIDKKVNESFPKFSSTLFSLCKLSEIEYRTCLLIKLQLPPSAIAAVLCKERSAISNIRTRLYKKIFGKKGTAKEWDDFIYKLQ